MILEQVRVVDLLAIRQVSAAINVTLRESPSLKKKLNVAMNLERARALSWKRRTGLGIKHGKIPLRPLEILKRTASDEMSDRRSGV